MLEKLRNNFIEPFFREGSKLPEYSIFAIAFFTRFFRLGKPPGYIFDEVYYAFTAKEMLHGNPAAWEWWNTPPEGVAYEWTHPYLGKEFIVIGMKLFGENAFGWRFFSAFFGTGIIILIYFIALKLFKNRIIALLAAFIAAMDGLLLVMSRIAMQDSCFVFFSLLALLCFLYNRKLLTGIALGLAVATKWTGVYGIGFIGLLVLIRWIIQFRNHQLQLQPFIKELLLTPIFYLVVPIAVYLASYTPLFLMKHTIPGVDGNNNWDVFWGLQKQMWWYHTGLKATHAYESRWWTWIFDLRSVWIHVDYKDKTIANIYALGNPLVFWFGFVSIVFLVWEFVQRKFLFLSLTAVWVVSAIIYYGINDSSFQIFPVDKVPEFLRYLLIPTSIYLLSEVIDFRQKTKFVNPQILVVILGYFSYFLPWAASPRIMFLYHYTPAVPFLALASGYILYHFSKEKIGRYFLYGYLILLVILFIYLFPLWTGIHVPKAFSETYFIIPSWK